MVALIWRESIGRARFHAKALLRSR